MNPVLLLDVALALLEVIERGNAAVARMRELRAEAEAGTLTDERLRQMMADTRRAVDAYADAVG
jgi:hypothetical protein